MHTVVNRIEAPHGEKIQILAFRIERRGVVGPDRHGDVAGLLLLQAIDADDAVAPRPCEPVGEPAAVRGPIKAENRGVFAFLDELTISGFQIDQQQLAAVVGQGQFVFRRRKVQAGGPAKVEVFKNAGRVEGIGVVDLQTFFASRVRNSHETLAVRQPPRQAQARVFRSAAAARGAFKHAQREHLAARREQQPFAFFVGRVVFQVLRRGHKLAGALRARTAVAELDLAALVRFRRENVQVGARVINNAPAVGLRKAHVVVVVLGVAPQVFAGRPARIEVADTFMVTDEVNTLAKPQRPAGIAFQLDQSAKTAVAVRVDPQVSRRPAAVAFPVGSVVGVAADDNAAVGTVRQKSARADGQLLGRPAVGRNRVCFREVAERLRRVADEKDLLRRTPADDSGLGPQERQPPRHAAIGIHDEDFLVAFFSRSERDPAAVGRERGAEGRGATRRHPAGLAAAGRHHPQVFLTREHHGLAVEGRVTIVTLVGQRLTPYNVEPKIQGANSSSPRPDCSLLVGSPPATAT